jgi:hypothetical protein
MLHSIKTVPFDDRCWRERIRVLFKLTDCMVMAVTGRIRVVFRTEHSVSHQTATVSLYVPRDFDPPPYAV